MHSAADHDVFDLAGLDQVPHLTLGEPDAARKLFWRFEAQVNHACLQR
jgi:hypothetical protein